MSVFNAWTGLFSLLGDPSFGIRLLPKYGYFAILLAAFWEGEAVLIAAGTLCGAGYLDWRLTILAAAIGGAAGDQVYFYAAHERAARLIQKSSRLRRWYPKGAAFRTQARHSRRVVVTVRCGSAHYHPACLRHCWNVTPQVQSAKPYKRVCLVISLGGY